MWSDKIQYVGACSTMWCDAMRFGVMRCDAVWCDAMQCGSVWCDAIIYSMMWRAARCDVMQCDAVRCDTKVMWCGMIWFDDFRVQEQCSFVQCMHNYWLNFWWSISWNVMLCCNDWCCVPVLLYVREESENQDVFTALMLDCPTLTALAHTVSLPLYIDGDVCICVVKLRGACIGRSSEIQSDCSFIIEFI